jgi:hypothetical protein
MRMAYSQPDLIEYGRIGQLTQGNGTLVPDFALTNGQLTNTNTNCTPVPPVGPNGVITGCILATGSVITGTP